MKRFFVICQLVGNICLLAGQLHAQFQNDDLLIGRSISADTLALVRGGAVVADSFIEPFIQGMDFDNTGGIDNNAAGNLVMLDWGLSSGAVYIGATDGSGTMTRVGDFEGGFPEFDSLFTSVPASADTFQQVAVSPDNSKIAITTSASATPNGALLLFDYNPAQVGVDNTLVLTNGRALDNAWFAFGHHEVEWMDNDTLVLMDGDAAFVDTIDLDISGNFEVGSRTRRRELLGPTGGNQPIDSDSAPIAYNPAISPFVFLGAGDYDGAMSSNYVWVLDPNSTEVNGDWKQVARARFDTGFNQGIRPTNSILDIELLSDGTLAVAMFGGSIYTLDVSTLNGSVCGDPADFDLPDGGCGGLADDTGATMVLDGDVVFDTDTDGNSDSRYTFMTIARTALTQDGDFDGDGDVDGNDFLEWQRGNSSPGGSLSGSDLADWQTNYGFSNMAPIATNNLVPEPGSMAIGMLGLAGLLLTRTRRK